ncbi:MAG TPA: phosphatase PAP2 family protein [Mycobacteriales bacterium]|nr:phosphatase PAP2 family protein [Mycobacteriales bacterium]
MSAYPHPLIPRSWRPLALLSWLAAAAVLAGLSWHFAHGSATNRPDAVVGSRLQARLAAHPHLLSMAARLGSPTVVVGGAAVLALLCVVARRPKAAMFALVAAPAAGFVTEYVLKPTVHREQHVNALLFPSGHTTGAFALALTVVVLLLPHEGTRMLSAIARLLVAVAALAVAAVVAVAVVALGWHYVTDAIGGVVTAVVVVLGAAAFLDVLGLNAAATRPAGPPPRALNR